VVTVTIMMMYINHKYSVGGVETLGPRSSRRERVLNILSSTSPSLSW